LDNNYHPPQQRNACEVQVDGSSLQQLMQQQRMLRGIRSSKLQGQEIQTRFYKNEIASEFLKILKTGATVRLGLIDLIDSTGRQICFDCGRRNWKSNAIKSPPYKRNDQSKPQRNAMTFPLLLSDLTLANISR
jgi:hypothetical protein